MTPRILLAAALLAGTAAAQTPGPQPLPPAPATPAAADRPYPGTIRLAVDATDIDRRIFTVRETIPVAGPGPLTLLYPQWLPGKHAPRGPIDKLGGLVITAGDTRLDWRRDPVDMYAFHVDVPAGAATLEVEFQYLSPTETKQGRVVVTPAMLNLQWDAVALYPAGYFTRNIPVAASVRLPDGWKFATALEPAGDAAVAAFKPVSFETLVDSPMFAGRNFRQVVLDPGPRPVRLNIVADRPDQLAATDAQIAAHAKLVREATTVFGSRHYDHYDFLLAVSDKLGGIGLEHHRSSENGTRAGYFTDWDKNADARSLLPHEFAHSWNGKFRRGADSWTADFNTPMGNSLLWVYEGQTTFWGAVLAARSGLWSRAQALDAFAGYAAVYDAVAGRAWKPLADTVNDPVTAARAPQAWRNWQRSEDYYTEGLLVWLDADTLIRERSGGKRSLDDFAKAFFGVGDGEIEARTYTSDDVVAALNAVEPNDWARFLRNRLDGRGPGAPLDGLARGGYRLAYTETQSDFAKGADAAAKRADLSFSLGLIAGNDGGITNVAWGGPAFAAGLTVGTTILAVNGDPYDADALKRAITAARTGAPLELIVRQGDRFHVVRPAWRGGLRYPRLERVAGTPARLDALLTPRTR